MNFVYTTWLCTQKNSNHGMVITDYRALVEKNKRGEGGGSEINSDGVFKVRRAN